MKKRDSFDNKLPGGLSGKTYWIHNPPDTQIKSIRHRIDHVFESPAFKAAIEKIFKRAEEYDKKLKELKSKLFHDDVPVINFFMNKFSIDEIHNKLNVSDKNIMQVYDEFFSKKENLQEMFETWIKYDSYKHRSLILQDCLNAHYEKKYTLSVPCMLSQIDGLLTEIFKTEKVSNALRKIDSTIEDYFLGGDILLAALENQLFKPTPSNKKWNKNYPNRHLILHGKDISYFQNQYYSLRLILLLDFITLFIKK